MDPFQTLISHKTEGILLPWWFDTNNLASSFTYYSKEHSQGFFPQEAVILIYFTLSIQLPLVLQMSTEHAHTSNQV